MRARDLSDRDVGVTLYRLQVYLALIGLVVLLPSAAEALDLNLRNVLGVYAGHQVDNRGQYYSYAGATLPLTGTELSFEPFIDVFVARQKYFIKDGERLLPSYLNVYTAAVGVTKTFDRLNLSLSAGPALQSLTEKFSFQDEGGQAIVGELNTKKLGYSLSSYASYTMPTDRLEAILSYSSQHQVYFGRTRWKHTAYKKPEWYSLEINPGLELVAVGNTQFQAYSSGAVFEMKWKRFGLLVRGGFQYTTAFQNGQYVGIELFGTPF